MHVDSVLLLGLPSDNVLNGVEAMLLKDRIHVTRTYHVHGILFSLLWTAHQTAIKFKTQTDLCFEMTKHSAIVNSLFSPLSQGVELTEEDSQYVQKEVYASWLALLSLAPCGVVNRPATRLAFSLCTNVQIRLIARELGIPVIKEAIVPGTAAPTDGVVISQEVWGATFLGRGEDRCHKNHYIVANLEQFSSYAVCIIVGQRDFSFCTSTGYENITDVPSNIMTLLVSRARMLATHFTLTYAYVIFALHGDELLFTRIQTFAPISLPARMVGKVSDALVQQLLQARSDLTNSADQRST